MKIYDKVTYRKTNKLQNVDTANNNEQEPEVQLFNNFNGEALLVHGEKDPETNIALNQISFLCNQYNIKHTIHIIPGANHSFYSLIWEKEIYQIVENWLEQKIEINKLKTR
jgi:dipeptidyl aminopeptidase/acylaminoacyl peptidase